MESSVKERLRTFINYLNISEREFCRVIGVGSAYIASIKKSIKADKLEAITKQYPELNPIWLIRGHGNMLLNAQPEEEPVTPALLPTEILAKLLEDANKEKARLLSIIESQQRTIENLTESNKKDNAQPEGRVICADAK
jgi:transcriptional regulator with XRE-family HTH domain|nr:MAG TPA: repressor protein CI [Caudoviricetes sp.]